MDTKGRLRASPAKVEYFSPVTLANWAADTPLRSNSARIIRRCSLVQRYRRSQPAKRARQVRLLEVTVEQARSTGAAPGHSLVLRLIGGTEIEINDNKQIPMAAALVRAVAQPC
jgi:hypothetical protein